MSQPLTTVCIRPVFDSSVFNVGVICSVLYGLLFLASVIVLILSARSTVVKKNDWVVRRLMIVLIAVLGACRVTYLLSQVYQFDVPAPCLPMAFYLLSQLLFFTANSVLILWWYDSWGRSVLILTCFCLRATIYHRSVPFTRMLIIFVVVNIGTSSTIACI